MFYGRSWAERLLDDFIRELDGYEVGGEEAGHGGQARHWLSGCRQCAAISRMLVCVACGNGQIRL